MNGLWLSIQLGMECHHPNWLSLHHFSEGRFKPPTSHNSVRGSEHCSPYPLVNQQKNYGKPPFFMGKSTISMAIFNRKESKHSGNSSFKRHLAGSMENHRWDHPFTSYFDVHQCTFWPTTIPINRMLHILATDLITITKVLLSHEICYSWSYSVITHPLNDIIW